MKYRPKDSMKLCNKLKFRANQGGLVAIEFTLIAAVLFLVLFAIIGIAQVLYIYNASVNATRFGARLAVVCDIAAASNIKTKMAAKVSGLATSNINIVYNPGGCSAANCTDVTVSISKFTVGIASSATFPLARVNVPGFSTTLVRESMSSINNNVCL